MHICTIGPHEDVMAKLYEWLGTQTFAKGLVVGALGSFIEVDFGNPVEEGPPPKLEISHLAHPMEVISFTGEILRKELAPADMPKHAFDNPTDYIVHIHVGVASEKGILMGGGFRGAKTMRSLTIYILDVD